jgi:hypothetical protein
MRVLTTAPGLQFYSGSMGSGVAGQAEFSSKFNHNIVFEAAQRQPSCRHQITAMLIWLYSPLRQPLPAHRQLSGRHVERQGGGGVWEACGAGAGDPGIPRFSEPGQLPIGGAPAGA